MFNIGVFCYTHIVSGVLKLKSFKFNLSGWTKHFAIYFHKNQQMHQNYYFIVVLSQMLLHVLAHQRHHQGAHMILTSYLSVYITERIIEYRVK
jgi:hypothetical protein